MVSEGSGEFWGRQAKQLPLTRSVMGRGRIATPINDDFGKKHG